MIAELQERFGLVHIILVQEATIVSIAGIRLESNSVVVDRLLKLRTGLRQADSGGSDRSGLNPWLACCQGQDKLGGRVGPVEPTCGDKKHRPVVKRAPQVRPISMLLG